MKGLARLAGVVVVVLATANANAQGSDATKADALFREGRMLMGRGDYAAACAKLAESQRLDPAAGTLVNLSECLEKQGKLADALVALRDALKLLQPGDDRVPLVKRQIAALEKRVPRLTIRLAPYAPQGTTVVLDGHRVAPTMFGAATALNAGEHEIVVTAPGRARQVYSAKLRQGESRDVEVDAGDVDANARTTDSTRSTRHSSQRTLGFVVGGAGLVALGVAAVFRLQANSKYDEAGCTSSTCPPGDLADEADAKVKTATVAAVVGGLAVAGGVVLVLTSPSPSRVQSAGQLRIAPGVMVGGAGAQIGGVW